MGYELIQPIVLERNKIGYRLSYIKTESTRQELQKEYDRLTAEIEKLFKERA